MVWWSDWIGPSRRCCGSTKFGPRWDEFLPGVLWAYRNTPHESTKEKTFIPTLWHWHSITNWGNTFVCTTSHTNWYSGLLWTTCASLSSARQLAEERIKAAQKYYKDQYDKTSVPPNLRLGDWVLMRFPQEETGKQRKLSRSWHGPYRITHLDDPDVTIVKVFFPAEGPIQVHQSRVCWHRSRVCRCPDQLPAGFYWYGGKRKNSGKTPKWLKILLAPSKSNNGDQDTIVCSDVPISQCDISTGQDSSPESRGTWKALNFLHHHVLIHNPPLKTLSKQARWNHTHLETGRRLNNPKDSGQIFSKGDNNVTVM